MFGEGWILVIRRWAGNGRSAQIADIRRRFAERVRDPSETFLSAPTDYVLGVKRSCSSPVWTTQLGAHVPFASNIRHPGRSAPKANLGE
jgi:hypothetical protein